MILQDDLTLSYSGASADSLAFYRRAQHQFACYIEDPDASVDAAIAQQPDFVTLKRRFAIVPSQAGTLQLPALQVGYWNIASDRADAAELAAASIDVAASVAPSTAPVMAAPIVPAKCRQ